MPWYTVHTKLQHERAAEFNLQQLGPGADTLPDNAAPGAAPTG